MPETGRVAGPVAGFDDAAPVPKASFDVRESRMVAIPVAGFGDTALVPWSKVVAFPVAGLSDTALVPSKAVTYQNTRRSRSQLLGSAIRA